MLPRLLILILVIGSLAGGGYFATKTFLQSPDQILITASEKFAKLKTVHAEMDITPTSSICTAKQECKITGLSDVNIPERTQKTHMTTSIGGSKTDLDFVLLKEGELYIKVLVLSQDWIHLNTQTLKDQGNLPFDPESNDFVSQSLGFLKAIDKKSVVKLEDEIVDGIKTIHLRLDINTSEYMQFLEKISTGSALAKSFKDAAVKTDVWINKSTGYIVKMESSAKNLNLLDNSGKSSGSSDMVMKITYSKFDQSVDIGKPEGTIIEYDQFLKDFEDQVTAANKAKKQAADAKAAAARTAAVPACKSFNIREGEFASNKCYLSKDYDDLLYYLNAYNSSASSYNGAIASMRITCDGSDFFKNSCEQDKKTQETAKQNIDKYKATIQGIIARGK